MVFGADLEMVLPCCPARVVAEWEMMNDGLTWGDGVLPLWPRHPASGHPASGHGLSGKRMTMIR